MADAPGHIASAEYKQQCDICEAVFSVTFYYCPICGKPTGADDGE